MENFNLQSHLDDIYAHFPEADQQPLIGITGNFNDGETTLSKRYYDSVIKAGGVPVVIPPVADRHVLANTLDQLDGLLLSGGADLNPLWTGDEPSTQLHRINEERDLPELLITRLAYNRQIPILGICRGIQTLAVALGGRVAQDIYEAREQQDGQPTAKERRIFGLRNNTQPTPSLAPMIKHSQDAGRSELTHSVNIQTGSTLYQIYKQEKIYVNSFHHQAVSDCGKRFRITATAPDGVIEAIESAEFKSILGVQWHPECLESGLPLFQWLVRQATNFSTAKHLHQRIVTLDTHCDTPMFFPQGIHFNQRDPRILVDLQKMTEGHLSAVTMAAYLPQPKIGEQFSQKVSFNVSSPMDYADLIFNKIEDIVQQNSRSISIARTPADLYEDKRKGRKSIMFAIENGLALNHDLKNVQHFAQRGVVYITLCHNGDNDICDSAKGCNTHNGVSQFGERVIEQMNKYGIMVDLSHAAEKSFYDALDISQTPIVCSHSNCRALCDHPRNLTDDQLRALAQRGGLCHITLYGGFLRASGEATVMDALNHLEHAIELMGIDHVGLGTDFDGDGGVRGLADASELINFTLHLMRRKYSERDIERIWGGNWIRLMGQVQRSAVKN
ncbi:MAG: gamma-glutamyl-gamma-aminobutyrate hydrolase family protein [Prevotella sp.]|nr:gamma-glutamyl-gamma-aminobutyrate hydrolase family protein [Prevotella sp.]